VGYEDEGCFVIPIKLEIKNFLSYPEAVQTINFKGHNLICLSGKNGNGKSAMLDAITWALWGQARKVSGSSKADEGLLRLGQTRMMVSLEFEVGFKNYRVRREYAKTYGKPYSFLSFEMLNSNKNCYVSLSDKTSKKTQAKIESAIGIDFETFINTAFLRQGQSNEFSKKTPKERKQILASILGLEKYDRLSKRALEKSKDFIAENKILQKLCEQDEQIFSRQDEFKKSLIQERAQFQDCYNNIKNSEKSMFDLQQELSRFEEKKNNYEFIQNNIKILEKKIIEKQQKFKELIYTWKKSFYNSMRLPDLKTLEKERQNLVETERSLIDLQQKYLKVQEKILSQKHEHQMLSNNIKQEKLESLNKSKLDLEKKEYENKRLLEDIKAAKNQTEVLHEELKKTSKDLSGLSNELKEKSEFNISYEKIKTQFEKRRSFYKLFVQRNNQLGYEISKLLDEKQAAQNGDNPHCPKCLQPLSFSIRHSLISRIEKQKTVLIKKQSRLIEILKRLKALLVDQNDELKKQSKLDENFASTEIKHGQASCKIKEVKQKLNDNEKIIVDRDNKNKELAAEIKTQQKLLKTEQKEISKSLNQDKELIVLQNKINKLESEQGALSFDSKQLEQIKKNITKMSKDLENLADLEAEKNKQQERKLSIHQLCLTLKELKTSIKDEDLKLKSLNFDKNNGAEILKKHTQTKLNLEKTLSQKDKHLHSIGQLENELQRVKTVQQENKLRVSKQKKLSEEIDCYQELAKAFSKDGIQALLIEEVIPEIENEANEIISRLTDNQAQIFIESLRDLKKGGVKETLEIRISDTYGIRPYEVYSGGEAFRIDFALRIAISKLLARRAGARLQTLIIDEGFGSQDEEGLARLMNAIHAIHNDFSKVIIVSHLKDFKENFPVQFIVEKGPMGSVVRVEELG
jgi:DNA repair protein SbcC/Rad50